MTSRGADGEARAARHLIRRGWRILARNVRCGGGELDIVAIRRGIIAVVEVKTRSDPAALEEPVSPSQRRRIVSAARTFLARRPDLDAMTVRFDVIEVDRSGRRSRLRHVPDAFAQPLETETSSNSRSVVYATELNERRWIGHSPSDRSAS